MTNANKPRFDQQLSDTLDKSVSALDEETLQKLLAAKTAALATATPNKGINRWPPLAFAASVLLCLSVFLFLQAQTAVEPGYFDELSYIDVDPDMLESMDMLLALDELAEAG